MSKERTVAIIGIGGALGRAYAERFGSVGGWNVIGADIEPALPAQEEFGGSWLRVSLDEGISAPEQYRRVHRAVGARKLDAVLCPAGGWAGGSIADGLKTVEAAELMRKSCFDTAIVAACLAGACGSEYGALVLTGAKAALGATPGMVGYGMAKAATHSLLHSAAAGGLPPNFRAWVVSPETLDTPNNRKGMQDADFSSWTPLSHVADTIFSHINDVKSNTGSPPKTGSILVPETKKGTTKWKII